MFRTATQNRIGYGLLAVGVVAGLFGAYRNDAAIKEVNNKQTIFILKQCQRDEQRNDIVIKSLQGAKDRTRETFKNNPIALTIQLRQINEQIEQFKNSPPCELP